MKNKSTYPMIALVSQLPLRRRWQLALLILLMLGGGFSEVISLGLVVPFLGFLMDPVEALQLPIAAQIVNIFDPADINDLRWQFTALFIAAAVFSGAFRFCLIWVTTNLTFRIGHEIGTKIYRRVIHQPYAVHISRDSSEIDGAISKVEPVTHILAALLNGISAVLICLSILVTLIIISPVFTFITLFSLGAVYAVIMLVVRKRLVRNSVRISQSMNERFKVTHEALGSIREILLSHGQQYFSNLFNNINRRYTTSVASNLIIGPSPRFIVEAFGVSIIAGFAYFSVMSTDGLNTTIPTLGAMALGAQRLLPNLQLIYTGITQHKGQEQHIFDLVKLLDRELLDQSIDEQHLSDLDPLMFENQIDFENVSFRFQDDSPVVLKELNFSITKSQTIGFAGPTGSGKSTCIDLLMGLLEPDTGVISVDDIPLTGKARLQWQKNIAHVPQDLYLMNASFAENIAFCKVPDDIDLQRVEKAAKLAHIHDFITTKPKGYHTLLGERGTQLSGGQRQRVGIARALYRRASVIVLDEATSSLDTEMEAAVMSSIENIDRNLTIIMIAHRISTLNNCDFIYKFENGCITEKMKI